MVHLCILYLCLGVDQLDGPVPVDDIVLGAGRHGLEAVLDLLLPAHILAVGGGRGSSLRLEEEAVQQAAHPLWRPRPPRERRVPGVHWGRGGKGRLFLK